MILVNETSLLFIKTVVVSQKMLNLCAYAFPYFKYINY